MRKTKRLLATLLAMMLLLSCFVVTAASEESATVSAKAGLSDVADNAIYATAVKTLNLMKIINGYPDGTFGPDKNVTRAEFTAMLMRTLNLGGQGAPTAAALPFSDVDDQDSSINWAIPDINIAYAKGIINGYEDGTFRPNANVAYQEAIKMIVCSLGYNNVKTDTTPWYTEYLVHANRLGILETAQSLGAPETPASRACIAQILYDSLEVPLVENDLQTNKTILTDYLHYTKNVGVVSANGVTSLVDPDVNFRNDEMQIYALEPKTGLYEAHLYKTTNINAADLFGHKIEFYYKEEGGTRTLILFVDQGSKTLELTPDMIEKGASSSTQLRYYQDANAKNTSVATIDPNNKVIFNGKLYGTTNADRFAVSMLPDVGSVKLVDSDNDGKYDIVDIVNYEVYYVSSKISTDYSILDDVIQPGGKRKLILDVDDPASNTTIVNAQGATVSYASIGIGNIICMAESRAVAGQDRLRRAVVLNDTVSGTVTAIDGDASITISGQKYQFSKAAPWITGSLTGVVAPVVQDAGVFCKDIAGDIVAYRKNAVSENLFYGYIMAYAETSEDFDTKKEFRVLSQSGSVAAILLRDNVQVNGVVRTADQAIADLTAATALQNTDAVENQGLQQVIKYTTKTSGGATIFDKIYTVTDTTVTGAGANIASDKLYRYNVVNGTASMVYNSNTRKLTGAGATVDVSGATVFVVPHNRNAYNDYAKKAYSAVFKGTTNSYNVEIFDLSTTNSAKVVVCYGEDASSSVQYDSPINIVSEHLGKANPSAGEEALNKVKVFSSSGSAAVDQWISAEGYQPAVGDVYRAGTDAKGYIKIENAADKLLYRAGDSAAANFGSIAFMSSNSLAVSADAVLLAHVFDMNSNEDGTEVSLSVLPRAIQDNDNGAGAEHLSAFQLSGAKIIRYTKENGKLKVEDLTADRSVLKELVGYRSAEGAAHSKVLVHLVESRVKTLCILD